MYERCVITDQIIRSVDKPHTSLINKSLSSSPLYIKGDHFILGHSAEKAKRVPIHMQKKYGAHPSQKNYWPGVTRHGREKSYQHILESHQVLPTL